MGQLMNATCVSFRLQGCHYISPNQPEPAEHVWRGELDNVNHLSNYTKIIKTFNNCCSPQAQGILWNNHLDFILGIISLLSTKQPVWHMRVLPRIAAQQYGDENKLKW